MGTVKFPNNLSIFNNAKVIMTDDVHDANYTENRPLGNLVFLRIEQLIIFNLKNMTLCTIQYQCSLSLVDKVHTFNLLKAIINFKFY